MDTKQNICCITGHQLNKFTFRYDEAQENCIKLKMKLAVEIEECAKRA